MSKGGPPRGPRLERLEGRTEEGSHASDSLAEPPLGARELGTALWLPAHPGLQRSLPRASPAPSTV